MTYRGRSIGWTWVGAALLPLLLLALVAGAGMRATAAQDATPEPAGEEGGRPAHIHTGTCQEGELGDVVQALSNLTAPEGDEEGPERAVTAENSFTTVPVALDDILAEDHAINIHLSQAEIEVYIACGEIGGTRDENGNLVIGLREQNGSGFTGIAFLAPGADGTSTDVSVFIAEGLAEGAGQQGAAGGMAQGTPLTGAETEEEAVAQETAVSDAAAEAEQTIEAEGTPES